MYNEMKEFRLQYWNEYLYYEKEFISITDYIHLDKRNLNTYSFKLLEMLIGICSALDRMFRKYTNLIGQSCNIKNYKDSVASIDNKLYDSEIRLIDNEDILLKPFNEWEPSKNLDAPKFWNAYNDIKHDKNGGIINATYENVLNALSALYLLNINYMNRIYTSNNKIYQNVPDNINNLFYIEGFEERCRQDLIDDEVEVADVGNETIIKNKFN